MPPSRTNDTGAEGWTKRLIWRFLDYVTRYASKDAADEAGEDSESDDEMSSVGSYDDEEPAGNMDEL